MKNLLLVIICIFLISGCAPSQADIEKAIFQTQTAMPTQTLIPTPTLIPLSMIDISNLLIQQYDLPSGFSGAQISKNLPDQYKDIQKPDYAVYQEFTYDGKRSGGVAIFAYSSEENTNKAYDDLLTIWVLNNLGIDENRVTGIGEIAAYGTVHGALFLGQDVTEFKFKDCGNFVVNLDFQNIEDYVSVQNYAENLDKRLSPIFCLYK